MARMAENEMRAMRDMPLRVRSTEGLGRTRNMRHAATAGLVWLGKSAALRCTRYDQFSTALGHQLTVLRRSACTFAHQTGSFLDTLDS